MEPILIQHIEKQAGKLSPLPRPADLSQAARFKNNRSYVLDDEGRLLALNLSGAKELREISLGEAAATLQYLVLGENKNLAKVTFQVPMPDLKYLDLSECALTELTLPAGFKALEKAYLQKNKLKKLHFGGACPALLFLDLSENELENLTLPGGFESLAYLYLNNNRLKKLAFAKPPLKLEILHLRGNQLEDLPANLLSFKALQTLYLHGNPLPGIPKGASGVPEGKSENAAANIRNYLRSITEDEALTNDEVKLVLLGNSTAGKTNLFHCLKTGKYEPNLFHSTHGLVNELWELPDPDFKFKVNVWDFGGQEFYHATHRLFLSDNAVSLVVFEQATNFQGESPLTVRLYKSGSLQEMTLPVEHFHFTYWLDNLAYWCKNPGQHTCLVQTKMDKSQSIPTAAECTKYGIGEERVFRVSSQKAGKREARSLRNFDDFRQELFGFLEKAKAVYPFSEKWLLIKNDLRDLPDEITMMTWQEYVDFCEERRAGISEVRPGESLSMLDTLTAYLHETGVVLSYRDIEALRDTVFVKPKWVADLIYRVLDYEVMEKGGKFSLAHVQNVTPPELDAKRLIALMEKFELIFPVSGEPGMFAAPQYLPRNNPKAEFVLFKKLAEQCRHLLFRLHFPQFLPRSVMTRFMCQYGPLSKDNYWKNGILFEKDGTWALVECEPKGRTISVASNQAEGRLAAELFASFCHIARHHPDIEVSVAGSRPVALGELEANENREGDVRTVNGDYESLAKFKCLFGHGALGKEGWDINADGNEIFAEPKMNDMNHIKELIADSRLEEALTKLLDAVPEPVQQEVYQLRERLNWLERQSRMNLLSYSELSVERSKITAAALELCSQPASPPTPKGERAQGAGSHVSTPLHGSGVATVQRHGAPKIYFSYAWGDGNEPGESREKIVNELYNSLLADGYDVRRDKMNLEYGGLISDFMREIGQGDLVAVFVSDKYLRSVYCMWELCEIYRNSLAEKDRFASRILPVRVESLALDNPKTLTDYLKHWKDFFEEWNKMVREFPQQVGKPQLDAFEKSRTIKDQFGNVVGYFQDMNAKNNSLLAQNDFAEVKKTILARVEKLAGK